MRKPLTVGKHMPVGWYWIHMPRRAAEYNTANTCWCWFMVQVLISSGVVPAVQNGAVSVEELQQVLSKASKEFSHFEEHARFLQSKNNRCSH